MLIPRGEGCAQENTVRAEGRHRINTLGNSNMQAKQQFKPARAAVVVAVAGALAMMAGGAWAQGLKEVVVTATGFEQQVTDAPASISVITQEQLKKKPFRDLTDALSEVEGVTVTGTASEKDIFIRGMPGAYTLILVDGKRQSTRDARTNGNAGFEQTFIPPLDAIERIEVVRGPMSSLYGSDAMGGVINIITKKVAAKWGGSVTADATLQQHGDSGDSYQGQFYVNGPIATDVLGLQMWGRVYKRQEDRILNGNTKALDTDFTASLSLTPNKDHDILAEIGTTQVRRDASSYHTLAATRTTADTYNENPRDHMSLSHTGRYGWATSDVSISYEKAQRKSYTESPVGSDSYTQAARAPKIENLVMDGKLSLPLGAHWLVLGGQWNEATLTDVNPGVSSTLVQQFKITQKALFVEDEWKLTERLAPPAPAGSSSATPTSSPRPAPAGKWAHSGITTPAWPPVPRCSTPTSRTRSAMPWSITPMAALRAGRPTATIVSGPATTSIAPRSRASS
jgi:outer membrane receptor for ferrienterochelin and colicins